MQSNDYTLPRPPDPTSIMLDQMRELRSETRQISEALGWSMGQLSAGREVHRELKTGMRNLELTTATLAKDVAELKRDRILPRKEPEKTSVTGFMDSASDLLQAGRPYLFICAAFGGKLLGLGPSWIEPLVEKVVSAL